MFIGIPSLITLLAIRMMKKPESLNGIVFLSITLFLLLSMVLFGEGFACILMGAPIFYGAAALILLIRDRLKSNNMFTVSFVVLFIVATEFITTQQNNELQSVTTEVKVDQPVELDQLASEICAENNLPKFFHLGFPRPETVYATGIEVNDTLSIPFVSQTKGKGHLVLLVESSEENKIIFRPISDDTHIAHWMTWKKITVEKTGNQKVKWTSEFICDLGPSWYFLLLEKYAVNLMNEHLSHVYFD